MYLDELVRRLETSPFERWLVALPKSPRTGSAAAADCHEPLAVHAHQYPCQLLGGAYDHLLALQKVVLDGRVIPLYSAMTLLRGALEAVWMARWVLDDSEGNRISRGVSLHQEDLRQRSNFEKASGISEQLSEPARAAGNRQDELRVAASTAATFGDSGLVLVRVPKYVELARMYPTSSAPGSPGGSPEDEEWLYRLLSGYAHSRQWVMGLGVTETTPLPFESVLARSTLNHEWLLSVFDRVMSQIDTAKAALGQYVDGSSASSQ